MPDKEFLLMLMQVILNHGNINYLGGAKYSFTDIRNGLRFLESKGYIDSESLTEKGRFFFDHLNKQFKRKGLYRFVSPNIDERIPAIGKYDCFAPSKKLKKDKLF